MLYSILKFVTNTAGEYSAIVVSTHDNISGAKVKYHQLLASLHNAPDVLFASVKLVNEYGNDVTGYFEMVDHRSTKTEETETE